MNKDPPKSLFVTNLPYSLDFEDFKSYFTKFGPVERFDIPDHPAKPIAFVHFENAEDAANCLNENNGILYQGKILRIKFSSKAKPEHAPPLPASIRTETEPNTNNPSLENQSNNKENEIIHSPPEKHLHPHKSRYENIHDNRESRRRDSPNYEVERRRDPYNRYDYIDKTRERIQYRDRMDREPTIRERDYYDDYRHDYRNNYRHDRHDFHHDYENYSYHRPTGDYRERGGIRDYHDRDLRMPRERDIYYDYQYPPSSQPPMQQAPEQLPRTLAYPVSQNSPILVQNQPPTAPIQSTIPNPINSIPVLPQQQINDLVRMVPRSTVMRQQLTVTSPLQTPTRISQEQPPLPPPPRGIPSSIQQTQQQQYEYDGNNQYYSSYR